jgi:hypothetical protein
VIVVVRRAALGDFVLTLPVVQALRALGPVTVLTDLRYRPLVPADVAVLPDDDLWRGRLPSGVDLAIAFSPAVADALREAGAPDVRAVPPFPPPGVAAWRHYARVLDGLPVTVDPPRIACPSRPDADAPVVLAPGSGGRQKCWPLERWRAVADALTVPVTWVRGPDEAEEAWSLPAVCPDIAGLVELAARCGAWLGPDSGPSHLAAAVGAPTGAVFGPTDPCVWAPPSATVLPWDSRPEVLARWATDARLLRISDARGDGGPAGAR